MDNDRPGSDKRQHTRVKTSNLISYVCINESGSETGQGMGKAEDVSQGGMLLRTYAPISARFIVIMAINLSNKLIRIKGQITHTRKTGSGEYLTGIRFIETPEKQNKIIADFIKIYHHRK
mgnify:CR=1 FL=1